MAKTTKPFPGEPPTAGGPEDPQRTQVVVIVRPGFSPEQEATLLANAPAAESVSFRPLFNDTPARLSTLETSAEPAPDLSVYYVTEVLAEQADPLIQSLLQREEVEGAYVQPQATLPFIETAVRSAAPDPSVPITPSFVDRQGYLQASPQGVDAVFAWTYPGGRGANVQVIDIEGGWNFTHEDLAQNSGGLLSGVQRADWRNHGTAVLGVIGGDTNTIGVTGISPDANLRAISVYRDAAMTYNLPQVIQLAADSLRPGDIILIEQQYSHPTLGLTTVEWWPADFDAIRYAVSRGVIVVEAAGNGNNNLDAAGYNTALTGFPATWRNPFNRANRDSGAVVVGAGNPPPGTHGRNAETGSGEVYTDRARCNFSNFGSMIDVQGWGWEVTTTGYGDLQGGPENEHYTDTFNGTSSASPIVVGTLACLQGILRAYGRIPLTPARAREVLRTTGSPQQAATGRPLTQRIGNRPDLRQLIPLVLQTNTWSGVQFTGSLGANATGRWYTFNWPAHWHVVWTAVPTTPVPGAPQLKIKTQVERASDGFITYWLNVTNLSNRPLNFEGRFTVLGW